MSATAPAERSRAATSSATVSWGQRLIPSLPDLLFLVVFCRGVFTLGSTFLSADGDAAEHLRLGLLWLHGTPFPAHDPWTLSAAGQGFMRTGEWLSDVIMAGSLSVAGLAGPVFLTALLGGLAVRQVAAWLIERDVTIFLVLGLSVLAMLGLGTQWLARPHMASLALFPLWIILMQRLRAGQLRRWWLFLPISALWANLHVGFFIVAVFMLGLAVGCDLLSRVVPSSKFQVPGQEQSSQGLGTWNLELWTTLGLPALCLLAGCITPQGPRAVISTISYVARSGGVNSDIFTFVGDVRSPIFAQPILFVLALIFVALLVLALLLRPRISLGDAACAAFLIYLSFYSSRNLALSGLLMPVFLGPSLQAGLRRLESNPHLAKHWRHRLVGWREQSETMLKLGAHSIWTPVAAVALAVVVIVGNFLWFAHPSYVPSGIRGYWGLERPGALGMDDYPFGPRFDPAIMPVGAAKYMINTGIDTKNCFNLFLWGGYLEYALPDAHIFIDGLQNIDGPAGLRDYTALTHAAPGSARYLTSHGYECVLMDPGSTLIRTLVQGGEWKVVYRDSTAEMAVPTTSAYAVLPALPEVSQP